MTSVQRQYTPQQGSQTHLFGHIPSHGQYNSLPTSPRSHLRRDQHSVQDVRSQGGQMPQQYAHPLLRNNTYPPHGSVVDGGASERKQSEHMLRRKTPNGILAAAYDGTSVEQAEKPHAMKHILLPVTTEQYPPLSSLVPSVWGLKQDLPLRSHSSHFLPNYNQAKQPPQTPSIPNHWDTDVTFGFDLSSAGWKRPQHHLPQIDSMLNQIPTQNVQQYPQIGQQFCGQMQNSLQTPLGPTVSNHEGPYGPYWPNGTFIPYRPAALRDPRFLSPSGTGWAAHHGNNYVGKGVENWQSLNNVVPAHGNVQNLNYQKQQPLALTNYHASGTSVDYAYPHGFHANQSRAQLNHLTPNHGQHQNHASTNPFGTPVTYPSHNSFLSRDSGQSSSRGDLIAGTPLADFGPHSSNAQLRERVFTWAHTIYVDLLAFLQQTRKSSSHNRHLNGRHHPPRPNIYPKPPRQPGANFSSSSSRHSKAPQLSATSQPSSLQLTASLNDSSQLSQDPTQQRSSISHSRSNSTVWSPGGQGRHDTNQVQASLQHQQSINNGSLHTHQQNQPMEKYRTLRRSSGQSISQALTAPIRDASPTTVAMAALEGLLKLCQASNWEWIDGMLLGGCLAYALGDYQKSLLWNTRILDLDRDHVEAISNLAATLLALNRRHEAEQHWLRAVKLRPSYFEAVEHLIGLLCGDHRGAEAVKIIDYVENSLRYTKNGADLYKHHDTHNDRPHSFSQSPSLSSETSDKPHFDFDGESEVNYKNLKDYPGSSQPGFGSSGYAIPGSENGRILALVHAKGNMLYALGDNIGAAKAFENAVLIGAGRRMGGISGLIKHILIAVTNEYAQAPVTCQSSPISGDPILLHPDQALLTSRLCFHHHGELPGLRDVPSEGMARKAAISTTSNSLLSLAKIFQDGMASNNPKTAAFQSQYGVREILALYYLSLSLQPSPSTANNVGILLASVQQSIPAKHVPVSPHDRIIPGIVPGSSIALALAYYNYGLHLDSRHAHLFTNLGSLLKDVGQLNAAIQMYESAVACDGNFDIALANLANAVKDQGRISDAITYYRRAVQVSPEFAEAVCGLANALNSVCGWSGRGGIASSGGKRDRWHVDDKGMLLDSRLSSAVSSGWIKRVVDLVEKQLADGEDWGKNTLDNHFIEDILRQLTMSENSGSLQERREKQENMRKFLGKWSGQKWEGARLVRLAERATRRLMWQWYQDKYVKPRQRPLSAYNRPLLPSSLPVPAAPTVLPFHTFTCPMSAKQIRLISQRNGLRISASTLKAPWLPQTVFPPPPPPSPYLKVGYVSSDFNNHPLAHLMQSVFGMHDPQKVKAICYATTASDKSVHRQQIEKEAPLFYDASSWPAERLVNQIVQDGCHILINLNGYTRGARNEVFAARPAPIQMSFMGFAGTLGAEWCDYLLADETAVPRDTLRPWRRNVDLEDSLADESSGGESGRWVYGENIAYCRDTFFCCDHRQSAPDSKGKQYSWEEEQSRRWKMRKEIFPTLADDAIIFGNFNQLYKIEPTTFRTWLRILARLPKAVLWLLRFPDLGEQNLRQTATQWAGPEVASRVLFTDVAPKQQHISRARICDLFLDTPECNAHTTAADVLWSGTPILTLPRYRYKMCSRMAASILKGALPRGPEGEKAAMELIATSDEDYEEKAVRLGRSCMYDGHKATGRLSELRKLLYASRWTSPLFDTLRWVKDLEEVYEIAWGMWVKGEGGDIQLPKGPEHIRRLDPAHEAGIS